MRQRYQAQAWNAQAFTALSERLHDFEFALHGRRLLEVHCGPDVGFGFLLEWLRPARLVAVDVESPRVADARLAQSAAEPSYSYGPDGSFEAVFLLARSQLKRALRRFSFPEAARVLVPGGLLVVMSLELAPDRLTPQAWEAHIDRHADAWGLLHRSLAGNGFQIGEEHLGASRLLVARRREPA
jgi:hypothetical protein